MNSVTHFQMPAEDRARMIKFYEAAFGWKCTQLGPEMGDYVTVQTGPTDDKMMVLEPGVINGGFYTRTKNEPQMEQGTRITISVEDWVAAAGRVTAAGGTMIGGMAKSGEPDEIPGVGLFGTFIDTEGNHVSMIQPFPRQ